MGMWKDKEHKGQALHGCRCLCTSFEKEEMKIWGRAMGTTLLIDRGRFVFTFSGESARLDGSDFPSIRMEQHCHLHVALRDVDIKMRSMLWNR